MMSRRLALSLALVLAACSGDDEVTPDASSVPDAAPGVDGPEKGSCTCFVATVDYMSGVGAGALVKVPSLEVQTNVAQGAVSGDPVVRLSENRLLVINRFGFDNVTVLESHDRSLVAQVSVGSGFNPQDAALRGNELWVVGLGAAEVRVFDVTSPLAQPVVIPLPTIAADADGNPDASSIVLSKGKAYVVLQHLESFAPVANGQVVIIDAASKQVGATVDLTSQNPANFARLAEDEKSLYVATTPGFSPTMGCLERVSLEGTPAATCAATSAELGGFITGMAPLPGGDVALTTAQSFTAGELVVADLGGAQVTTTKVSSMGQQPSDVASCAFDYLVAADATTMGIRVYRLGDSGPTELTTSALDVGLPPAFAGGIVCVGDPL
jgi:hypothetical protein